MRMFKTPKRIEGKHMQRTFASRIVTLIALVTVLGTLITVTTAEPADAITFNLRDCSVSAGNGYYSYYWAVTESNDSDCWMVGTAFNQTSYVYDGSRPYSADKVSVSEPGGTVSQHRLYDAYGSATRIISYTW